MVSDGEEDDSPAASSENDGDDTMEDLDEGDADVGGDMDADGDNDDENDENEDDEEQDESQDVVEDTPTRPRAPKVNRHAANSQTMVNGSRTYQALDGDGGDSRTSRSFAADDSSYLTAPATPNVFKPSMRPDAVNAVLYDIAPTIAAPHSTSINSVTATPDMRWVFSGGSDGWVRKFNWVDTANAKSMLTVAQRHPFVDSVTKAGVLMSYWENEDTLGTSGQGADDGVSLSPVYSLAVHHQALWLLSGTESGAINLQSVRHDEGKRITSLYKHTSAVSVLSLAYDEQSVLSGSWDKSICDWDLNTGQVKRCFTGSGGQISALEIRPMSHIPIPNEAAEVVEPVPSEATFFNSIDPKPLLSNGIKTKANSTVSEGGIGSPNDSLFGGIEDNESDSLFGDDDGGGVGDTTFNEDDDEFAKALATGNQGQASQDADGDLNMEDHIPMKTEAEMATIDNGQSLSDTRDAVEESVGERVNGSPHAEELFEGLRGCEPINTSPDLPPMSESTFLDAAHDGTLRIWDRRVSTPIVRIPPPRSVPPWCMHACWSPDGNFIYAGRRNGTVDEYSIHKGFREPRRSLRFPPGSGAVSALRAMPNGRHLVCASHDILRLYDLKDEESSKSSTVPFLIVPGHRTGVISQLYIDPTCTFMISTGGNRGWEGSSTEVLLGYEIGIGRA